MCYLNRAFAAIAVGASLLSGGASYAAEARSDFQVAVKLVQPSDGTQPPANGGRSDSPDFCVSRNVPGAFGADVTVVCSTGVVVQVAPSASASRAPQHGGAHRFLLPFSWAGLMSVDSDISTGLGTVTSWRVVRLVDRAYLEMTVHW